MSVRVDINKLIGDMVKCVGCMRGKMSRSNDTGENRVEMMYSGVYCRKFALKVRGGGRCFGHRRRQEN